MKLTKIEIENYRSIEKIDLYIEEINGSYSFGLLGINESGKSSLLKGISLKVSEDLNYPSDYNNESQPVKITFKYEIDGKELKRIQNELNTKVKIPKELSDKVEITHVELITEFENSLERTLTYSEKIHFEEIVFKDYVLKEGVVVRKTKDDDDLSALNIENYMLVYAKDFFIASKHNAVLWRSTPEYLMLDDIVLDTFANSPKTVSIPLLNSFILAGYKENDLVLEISKLIDPIKIDSMESRLSDAVTKHIMKVWPEHEISLKYKINNNKISLLIEDNGVKYKPKTTSQRSDGFKQFISFLLTISIENTNEELKNTILLIDEPETHLHPPAQINLLNELISITSNQNNNILFFATHSNYMIDKNNVDRNYKIKKENNSVTKINKIEKKTSSYAEINFEVFNITNNDYHNELYGYIESEAKSELEALDKEKHWKNIKTGKTIKVSLPEYIRHSIHHPENKANKKFKEEELLESINILRNIKASI